MSANARIGSEQLMSVLDTLNDTDRPSFSNLTKAPATIRFNNPGAIWWTKRAEKFRSVGHRKLNDGLNQGNQIAIFEDAIAGAAYMFDVLDRVYVNKTVREIIKKWSGGNSVESYLSVIQKRTDIEPSFFVTKDYLRNPNWVIPFAQAMAAHETGIVVAGKLQDYPLDRAHWELAFSEAFNGAETTSLSKAADKTKDIVTKKPFSFFGLVLGLPALLSDGLDNVVDFAQKTAVKFSELTPVKSVMSQVVDNTWAVGAVVISISAAFVLKEIAKDD